MNIRPYLRSDEAALRSIFEQQQFEYEFPDLSSPLFLSKTVLEERSFPVMAVAAKLTAEIYLLADPQWGTPSQRWRALLEIHEAARADVYARGLDDCYCWLPPQIERSFSKRLLRLGWAKNKWASFTRNVSEPTEDLRTSCEFSHELSTT